MLNEESHNPFTYYQSQGLEGRVLARQHQHCTICHVTRESLRIIMVRHCPWMSNLGTRPLEKLERGSGR